MSVDAFTVEGEVILKTDKFDSAIGELVSKLEELKNGLSNLGINAQSFANELANANAEMTKAYEDIAKIDSNMLNAVSEMGTLRTETSEFNTQLSDASETVSALKNETSTLVYDFNQFTTATTKAVEQVQILTNEFSSMRYYVDMVKASEEGMYKIRMDSLTALQSGESKRIQNLHNIIDYLHMEEQQMEANASIQKDIILRLEREAQKRKEIMQNTLDMAKRELHYLEQQHQAELKIYDDIVRRYEAQGRLATTVQEQLGVLAERNATEQEEIAFLDEQLMLQKSIHTLTQQGGTENIKQAEALMKQLQTDTEIYTVLQEEIALEKQKLKLIEEENAMLNEQGAVRKKNAVTGAKGNQLDKMGYLPSRIGSMALTMWGFNEIMDIYNKSMQNMNALGQQKAYTDLMKTDNRYLQQTNQNVSDITSGINKMNKAINESYKGGMSLQKMYQKVDMQSVGANAMDSAFKYGVQADKLDELTEVMAIYGSEFVRQGRSQEDSILAVNDALDGEYRRLKEVNIGKEELEAHGYKEGDTLSMITALREIAQERGYDVVAQKVTNLSDAITVLEIRIAQDLVGAFKVLEPVLTEVAKDFITILDTFEWVWSGVRDIWNDFTTELDKTFGVQNVQKYGGGLLKLVGWVITLGITFGVVYKIVSSLKGMLGGLFNIFGKGTDEIAKTTGDVAKTGGTVGKDTGGGFKDNFMKQWSKVGSDLGKMARVFVDVAVAMGMAFLLIEEGILIVSSIGYTYESLKPQFESGVNFIKEFGVWFALLGGAIIGLSYALGDLNEGTIARVGQGALNIAQGIGIAMGVVAVAIGSLLMPMMAIISLGALANWQQGNLDKGIEVIQMFADALNYITAPVGVFLIALGVASVVLGYAPMLGVGLAVGIAISIGLVAEAIFMLNAPLMAIASLGYVAQQLGQANIQQGAEALKIVGQGLKTIADAVPSLLVVDFGVLGQELTDIGSKLLTGKDGLTYLSENIIPTLGDFVEAFNNTTIDPINTTTVANLSQVASQLPTIKSAIDKIRVSVGNGGTGGFNILGFQIGGDTSSLKPKLDILYNDLKDVMEFANKLGGLSSNGGNGATAIQQTANAIVQLKAKLNLFVSTISSSATRVQTASNKLGNALPTGFKTGSASFGSAVVSVLAKGVSAIQSRYATFNSGGKALGQKLIDGFKNHKPTLKTITSREIGYALTELDNAKDDFYNKGKALGEELTRGYEDGADIHSPGLIARTTARELRYTMDALDVGKQMMYKGGVALGQALTNGYDSTGNLRTDVGVLASKGVNNQQLQANAKNVKANGNQKGQTPQLTQNNINIDMTGATIIGIQDLDAKIRASVEKAIVSINSPNGAIGY